MHIAQSLNMKEEQSGRSTYMALGILHQKNDALNPSLKHSFMNLALHFTKLFSVKGVPVFVFLTVSLNLARMSMLSAGEPV